GRSITLNGEAFEIVGVAPPEFVGTIPWRQYDLWLPLEARTVLVEGDERRSRDPRLSVLARLAPGVTAQQLQASLASVDFGQATGPRDDRHERTPVVSEVWRSPRYGGKVLVPLIIVVWIVGLTVLFIASANIAGVLLARFTAR